MQGAGSQIALDLQLPLRPAHSLSDGEMVRKLPAVLVAREETLLFSNGCPTSCWSQGREKRRTPAATRWTSPYLISCCTFVEDAFQCFLQGKSSGDGLPALFLWKVLFFFYIWRITLPDRVFLKHFFILQLLDMSRHSLLACRVPAKKFANSLMEGLLQVTLIFPPWFSLVFCLYLWCLIVLLKCVFKRFFGTDLIECSIRNLNMDVQVFPQAWQYAARISIYKKA